MTKCLLLLALVSTIFPNIVIAQTEAQIENLRARTLAAWKDGTIEAFRSLYSFNNTPLEIQTFSVNRWANIKEEGNTSLDLIRYFKIESVNDPGLDKELSEQLKRSLASAMEVTTFRDVKYISNLEILGFQVTTIKGTGVFTRVNPVGLKDGQLLFAGVAKLNTANKSEMATPRKPSD